MNRLLRLTFSVFLMMLAIVTKAQTTESKTVTFTAGTDKGSCAATSESPAGKDQVTKDGITIATSKGALAAAQYRIYKSQTFTVSSTVGKISKVVITCTKEGTAKYGPGCFTGDGYTASTGTTGTWSSTTGAESFTLTASTDQVRATKVEVTYTPSGETPATPTIPTPTITGETPFTTTTTVTITAEGANEIYYTTDGTDPTDESDSYTTPLTLDKTTTVKAVAEDASGNLGTVATKEFVKQAAEEPTGTVISTFPYSEAFSNTKGDFTTEGQANGKDVWSTTSSYGMKATAYISRTNYASEAWLTSPVFDLTNFTDAKLSFDEACNFFKNGITVADNAQVMVKETSATEWTALTATSTRPAGNSWTFSTTTYSLSAYNGKKIQIGFKYTSTTSAAGTWEIKNFKLDATEAGKLASVSFSTPTTGLKSVTATLTATEGDIYYTTDNTDPTSASQKYTAPIELTTKGTTTIKAVAISGAKSSEVASQAYTVVGTKHAGTAKDPLTPAEAIDACNAGYTDEATVHGFVSSVDTKDFKASYGNLTYYLKSNKDDESETAFEVYRGYGLNGDKFTSTTDLPVGSEVTVQGKLTLYKSTPEMNSGSKILSLTKAEVKLAEYTVAEAQAVLTAGTETTDNVYVTGIVSQIDEIAAMSEDGSKQYTNATYYISDDGTTTSQLEVFRGKGLANADFTDALQLEVGDKVKVMGVLKNYTKDDVTTQEITGSQLASLATPVKVSASGYGTLYYSQKSFTIPEGVEAYTYTVSDGKLTQAAVSTTIPAGEAVVLKAAEGTYDFTVTTEAATAAESNDLLGTDAEATPEADANSYFYIVSYDKDGKNIGFYWGAQDGAAFQNGAHKAYLKAAKNDAQNAKGWAFDGTATAINAINASANVDNAAIYNLAGQRVSKSFKGIVIKNGKKTIQ